MAKLNRLYKHMHAPDLEVWDAFHAIYGGIFDSIHYDVPVGLGRDPGYRHENNIRQMALKLSKRRIDAVAVKAGIHYLFEVTQHCSFRAIGQALVYERLYAANLHTSAKIWPIIVCVEEGTDIPACRNDLGITCVQINPTNPNIPLWHLPPTWGTSRHTTGL